MSSPADMDGAVPRPLMPDGGNADRNICVCLHMHLPITRAAAGDGGGRTGGHRQRADRAFSREERTALGGAFPHRSLESLLARSVVFGYGVSLKSCRGPLHGE